MGGDSRQVDLILSIVPEFCILSLHILQSPSWDHLLVGKVKLLAMRDGDW